MIKKLYDSIKLKYDNHFLAIWKYRFYKMLINLGYPILNKKFEKIGISEESSIIVSLTSFPERINTVWLTIVTLLSQTLKPKKVLLWLAKSQFEGIELPDNLKRLEKYGLEIKWCDDLKPHKKYYYTVQEYPDDCVVIADDDIFYPENHLEILWNNYLKHPDCIIENKTHRIEYGVDNQYLAYNKWSNRIVENPSYLLVPIGCNGVLYPPHSLPEYTFDKNYITEAALYTDDLWLKLCAIRNNKMTFSCMENELVYFDCIKAGKVGLWKSNTKGINRNDMVWKRLMSDFPQMNELLYKEWKREAEAYQENC